ncbi:uncharacterized protein LOC134820353 isoform X2 [Bolinopsis microptera]|uniref:uncharacterized protein LOC134820353 isoform X2 n=1 Tax=Bolinopsis microptera TaxID=2820187 RepID=UPI0030793E59
MFLMFEVIVTIPTAIMIYWLLSLHTDNFTGDNMLVYLHGIVMMFAFTYLLAQGIALVRVCPSSRHCARITHSIFNTLSLLFGIAGLILIISYKSENNKTHLYSLHSWCGILLLLILVIQFMGGCIVLQSCCKGASLKSRLNYVPNHVAMGTAVLLLAAVCVISGVVNLKEYIGVARQEDKSLDFENSLLNLMAGSALLVFVIILCIAVSRRSRKSGLGSEESMGGKLNFRDGSSSAAPHPRSDKYRIESSVKSKNISEDTAYSDFSSGPGSAHPHSERSFSRPRDSEFRPRDSESRPRDSESRPRDSESRPRDSESRPRDPESRPRDLVDQAAMSQRRDVEPPQPRRGSANLPRRDSGHRDGGPHSPRGPHSPIGPHSSPAPRLSDVDGEPTSPGRTSLRSQRSQRDTYRNHEPPTSPTVRSPDPRDMSRRPSFPPVTPGHYPQRHPSSGHQPRPPAPDYPRSDPSYQLPYHEPPLDQSRDITARGHQGNTLDQSRDITARGHQGNTLDQSRDITARGHQGNTLSSPDIPPLFENNVSHLRSSRRGVPPPLDMSPPVQFAPVNVVNPFPSRYGGQAPQNEDLKQSPMYSPDHTPSDRYNPSYPDQPSNPLIQPAYNHDNPQIQPAYIHENPQSPPYSPQQQTTTFNARPPGRHQVARQHRHQVRRAKVEKANLELKRPVTPPASSYTESLAPARVSTSPLQISSPESIPDVDSSVLSEDVDGPAPRRGRTSYRNAVRDDDPPPLVPPPPQQFEMIRGGSKDDDQGICWL